MFVLAPPPLAPDTIAFRSSLKFKAESAPAPATVLSMVNVSVVLFPGKTAAENTLLKVGAVAEVTTRSSLAAVPLIARPDTWPVTVLDVLENVPFAPAGTESVAENVQLAPAASVPPEKLRLDVPDRMEPAPQTFAAGRPVATSPLSAASRSSVKAKLLTERAPSEFAMVNSNVTELPAVTGSSVKLLENCRVTDSTTNVPEAASVVPKEVDNADVVDA